MIRLKKKHKQKNNTYSVELEKRQKHFHGAISFLRKTKISIGNRSKKIIELPWFLILGEPSASQSALLSNAKLKFILTKRNSKVFKSEQRHCDWWATREAVFLNCNPKYFKQEAHHQPAFWRALLGLIKKHHQPTLQGLIVPLDLSTLALGNKNTQNILFKTLKQRLKDIEEHLSCAVPIYFIFNHADCLSGFNEYFDNNALEELRPPWGICFNQTQIATPQRAADTFDLEYDNLLKDLNQQVIPKLHQQRNLDKRARIKDFPLQMESLKRSLAIFLQQMTRVTTGHKKIKLRGIYFTSLGKGEDKVDRLIKPLSQSFDLTLPQEGKKHHSSRTFFVEGLFSDVIFPDGLLFNSLQQQKKWRRKRWSHRLALGTAAAIILGTVATLSAHFTNKVIELNKAENVLAQFNILEKTQSLASLPQKIAALELLYHAKTILNQDHFPWFLAYSKTKRKNIADTAGLAYDKVLTELLTSEFSHILQQLTVTPNHPAETYGALKAYLMLNNAKNYDAHYLKQWLTHFIQNLGELDPQQKQTLLKHIANFTQTYHGGANIDSHIVSQAKQYLQQTPPPLLALAILNNDLLQNKSYVFYTGSSKLLSERQDITLPALYTEKNFRKVYDALIPIAVNTMVKGNWVTGNNPAKFPTELLIKNTRDTYLAQYMQIWSLLLAQLKLKQPQNLQEAAWLLQNFTAKDSPLKVLFAKIYQNTHITYENLPTPISIKFANLDNFISAAYFAEESPLRQQLTQWSKQLDPVSQSETPTKAAFDFVKTLANKQSQDYQLQQQLKHTLATSPVFIQQWVTALQQQISTLLLKRSGDYINQQWQQQIVSYYQNQIKPYYPFSPHQKQNLSLKSFNEFFNSQGLLAKFFTEYLAPFVDKHSSHWSWSQINGDKLPLTNKLLPLYQQAITIDQTLFNAKTRQYGIELALVPVKLNAQLKELDIALNDKGIQYTQTGQKPMVFYWPNNKGSGKISITAVDKTGKTDSISEQGPWALIKLLSASDHLQNQPNGKVLFTLQLNHQPVQFMLVSRSKFNPLGNNLLQHFNLPEKITL